MKIIRRTTRKSDKEKTKDEDQHSNSRSEDALQNMPLSHDYKTSRLGAYLNSPEKKLCLLSQKGKSMPLYTNA